ncbi:hypothetical protein NCC49_005305 [Naganishia albida]|nr:hypothetical protein NCC49_005305 [Naganishia albida]
MSSKPEERSDASSLPSDGQENPKVASSSASPVEPDIGGTMEGRQAKVLAELWDSYQEALIKKGQLGYEITTFRKLAPTISSDGRILEVDATTDAHIYNAYDPEGKVNATLDHLSCRFVDDANKALREDDCSFLTELLPSEDNSRSHYSAVQYGSRNDFTIRLADAAQAPLGTEGETPKPVFSHFSSAMSVSSEDLQEMPEISDRDSILERYMQLMEAHATRLSSEKDSE